MNSLPRNLRRTPELLAVIVLGVLLLGTARADDSAPRPGRAEIAVGIDEGDIRGSDQRALQMAVDYVARLGGGTVHIGPGRYEMRNALSLRDNVHVQGIPGKTVLVAAAGTSSPLALDGDCNERQVTLANPTDFRVGDGIAVADEQNGGGFEVTTATLTEQLDKNTFRISAPLYLDYMVSNNASARQAFPIVAGHGVKKAMVEGLTVEGARDGQPLDGCRGAGIYLFECEDVIIRNCTVGSYPGDGISFQVSKNVIVEDCVCEKNAGLGLHPGSGSQHPIVRRNVSRHNGSDGLFVCWRVKHGIFENNELHANEGNGISIGHKDTDNTFRENRVTENAQAGLLFRHESEAMGAHRNVFEANIILDNGRQMDADEIAAIVIRGHHHGLVFRGNTIGWSDGDSKHTVAIRASEGAVDLDAENNKYERVEKVRVTLAD